MLKTPFQLRWLLGALILGLGIAVSVLAQMPTPDKEKPVPPSKPSAVGVVLTPESLPAFLENLGYEVKVLKGANGSSDSCQIVVDQSGWKLHTEVMLSPSRNYVWLFAALQPIPDPDDVPVLPLLKLLEENGKSAPNYFALYKGKIFLQRAMDNLNITPARFLPVVNDFYTAAARTSPLWDTSTWTKGRKPPTPETGGKTPKPEDKKPAPEDKKPTPETGGTTPAGESPEALQKTFEKLLTAAKAKNEPTGKAVTQGFVLPKSEAAFSRIFGEEKGAVLAAEYADNVEEWLATLERKVWAAVEEGQTQVKVDRFDAPDPERATPLQNKALAAMKQKVPLYSVRLLRPGEETGLHLYSFAYLDGGFRYLGKMQPIAPRSMGQGQSGAQEFSTAGNAASLFLNGPSSLPMMPRFGALEAREINLPPSFGQRPFALPQDGPGSGFAAQAEEGGIPLGIWRGKFSTGDVLTLGLWGSNFYLEIPPQMPVTGTFTWNQTSPVGGILNLLYYSAGRPQHLYYSIGWVNANTIVLSDPNFQIKLRRQAD